jgi:hypothetical protein
VFRFYIAVKQVGDRRRRVTAAIKQISAVAGGVTVVEGKGGWTDKGKFHYEQCRIFTVALDKAKVGYVYEILGKTFRMENVLMVEEGAASQKWYNLYGLIARTVPGLIPDIPKPNRAKRKMAATSVNPADVDL